MKVLYLGLLFLVLASCYNHRKESSSVLFAGEIVNPTNGYVLLIKNEETIDSALLDKNNRFSIKLDSVEEGVYNFHHGFEYQYIYLKNNDSLLIRLNTLEFDESLVFSGKGEEINNFLLELFLVYEREKHLINNYYRLDPVVFRDKIDSLRNEKIHLLDELREEVSLSRKELLTANANINYTYNRFYERYPFKHRNKTGKMLIEKLPKDFYAYRKNVDFNNKLLTYYKPYYNFMKNYFGNLSYMYCVGECKNYKAIIKNKFHINCHKLKLIDSLVKEKDLKDNLFRNVAVNYLLKGKDKEKNIEIFMDIFRNISDNSKHIVEIDQLYQSLQNLYPNNKLPNIELYMKNDEIVSLEKISSNNKNTVFYFWSGTQKRQFNNILKHISKISIEYPEHTFVGINIFTDTADWKYLLESKKLNGTNQYRAKDSKKLTYTLMIDYLNKSIITKDGFIKNGFADIYTSF